MTSSSKKRRLLIPAALAVGGVTAGLSCSPSPAPACGSEQYHLCWPDGGFACPADCGGLKLPDGGLDLDAMGQPQCLC